MDGELEIHGEGEAGELAAGLPAKRPPSRRVKDVIPSGELFPDVPRRELGDLLDKDLVLEDIGFLKGRFGKFAILLAHFPNEDESFTFPCGGEVVVSKCVDLKEGRHLPITGAISYNGKYYDLQ